MASIFLSSVRSLSLGLMMVIGTACLNSQWATSHMSAPEQSANAVMKGGAHAGTNWCETIGSSVAVFTGTSIFSNWIGSGVSVGDGKHIITAFHCVEFTGSSVGVTPIVCENGELSYGDRLSGEVVAIDSSVDVALIKLTEGSVTPMPVSKREPVAGERVSLFGVVTLGKSGVTSRFSRVEGPVSPGDSGGAVVNDGGELVGIAVAGRISKPIHFTGPTALDGYYYVPIKVALSTLTGNY